MYMYIVIFGIKLKQNMNIFVFNSIADEPLFAAILEQILKNITAPELEGSGTLF